MKTEIVRYSQQHFDVMRRFAERTWTRPQTAAFYRWRYEDAPQQRAFLALHDGECLAMGCAFRRRYRIGDEIVPILETFDWYTLPGLRNTGLGVRIIQRFMAEPEPALLLGGSDDAVGFLARLKWQRAGAAQRFILRLGTRRAAQALERRLRIPGPAARAIASAAQPFRRRRRRRGPSGAHVLPVACVGDEVLALYEGPVAYGTLPLWTPEHLRWLMAGFAGAGHFVPLYFARGQQLLGWALLRVYETDGERGAELIELFNPDADADLYTWMVSELACIAEGFDADFLGASSTCPAIAGALAGNGFVHCGAIPIHLWRPGGAPLPSPMLFGSNTRDTPINPYPTHWWGEALPEAPKTAPEQTS